MSITVPDYRWYKEKSLEKAVPSECPFANVHSCPRYYESLYMLGEVHMITKMGSDTIKELDALWEKSKIKPILEEEMTYIYGGDGKNSTFGNFCPEVSYKYLSYYADYMSKYADCIDQEHGAKTAEYENINNDYRYVWAIVKETHYLDCSVFNKVKAYNSERNYKLNNLVHKNIVILIDRMEVCLEEEDYSGVLHASASVFETMAKDIIDSEAIENQTLGGFIAKFNKESSLPDNLKAIVKEVYNLRNTTPISGHGSTKSSQISFDDALVIVALTKAIVEIEYRASS